MKIFVLIYDRPSRSIVQLREFDAGELSMASEFRTEAQLRAIQNGADQDIVLLQARSLESLARTHSSYFLTLDQLIDRAGDAVRARTEPDALAIREERRRL
jgi:hypothetical protein